MLALWLPPCIYDRIRHSKPGECIWEPYLNKEFVIVVAALGHHGSCLIMLSCYVRVLIFMHKRKIMKATKGRSTIKRNSVAEESVVGETTHDLDQSSSHETRSPSENKSKPAEKYEASEPTTSVMDTNRISVIGIKERQMQRHKRERTVFITLTYVILGYAVCWIPFHVVFDISSVCPSCVPRGVFAVTFWMTYINSTINPFLYNFSNAEFRNTFRRLLCRC